MRHRIEDLLQDQITAFRNVGRNSRSLAHRHAATRRMPVYRRIFKF